MSLGIYHRQLLFFIALILVAGGAWYWFRNPLKAENLPTRQDGDIGQVYDFELTLTETGGLYLEKNQLTAETFTTDSLIRLRAQVFDESKEFIENLNFSVLLPKPVTDQMVSHRLINNGGALEVSSQLVDPQTIAFSALQVSPGTKLSIEIELPRAYFTETLSSRLKERLQNLPPIVWPAISIALPALTALILLMVALSRTRTIQASKEEVTKPPSRLAPAYLGIMLKGHLTSREVAATLIDLARRGHLVIRQINVDDFRFSRKGSADKLEPFEKSLIEQIFGPTSEQATAGEISLGIAQELFSHRISQAFVLAYQKMNDLGFFYTNPLRLHRRYQVVGISLFMLAIIGFFANIFLFSSSSSFLLFWVGMMLAALMVIFFSNGLPVRTILGDRELARWLAFRQYLESSEQASYTSSSQDEYLSYLGYAIVFECEVEWTRRFYSSAFAQPSWYVAGGVNTIDQFANKIFPFFGYLSHVLALSSKPGAR